MQFLHPSSLWLLLLGFIPLALYLFRRRSQKIRVSTLVFFKTLAREHQESAWLRRFKKWFSFLLTILLLLLAVFVLSRIIIEQDDADQYRTVVILLDRSASMEVGDESGESRLETAKRILKERLKKVPEEVGVSLIAYDVRPEVIQPRTMNRRELLSRLENVAVRPMADRSDVAMESARMIAGLEPPSVIWHVSDHPISATGAIAEAGVHELNLALPEAVNCGITALQLRAVPLEHSRYDAFVQVALNADSPRPVNVRLNVSVGGIPSQFREIELQPAETTGVTFRINGATDQILRVWLETERDDFALDDQVTLSLPEAKPILAAWIRPDETEDPYTRLALSSIQETGTFELLKGNPGAWPLSEKVDAVIFDGWLPPEWPTDIPAVVINPPGSSGPVIARKLDAPIPYDSVRVGNADHPVLFRISSSRVALARTAVLEARGSLEPLWFAGKDPVLAAGEVGGKRLVVMAFSPGLSDRLPLMASFPILMGNALYWCVGQEDGATQSRLFNTGEMVAVEGESISWDESNGGSKSKIRLPLTREVIEMDRVGVWTTDTGQKGASQLLSAPETNLPSRGDLGSDEADYFHVENGFAGNMKLWLLSVILLILLLESWLFHRHAVY
ncbi:MAG: BatA and WFA domain-containing protein [Verrucomicrobiales bacterium]|jgi:hypothetical protein|nr:BatA and WFA domain-containing protein [Verrucomicrobiales bacterium]MBP9223983.1 BatA and WFA domain-containing protein [Verrucomicrobiales bacterium]